MNFRRTYSKNIVIRALVQGVAIGLVAVLVIGLTISITGGKEDKAKETVATTGPKTEEKGGAVEGGDTMFVKQHGVFSSQEAATGFVAENPSLASTAVVPVGGQFYVWGAVWLKESDVILNEGEDAFKKRITVVPGTCKSADANEVKKALLAEDLSKIELSKDGKAAKKDGDFTKKVTAITAFTKDSSVARLHLLAHYSNQDPCFKIQF
ncbi:MULTISPECIES: hypothetical protein [unclassified Sporosarcina]|uniref:hypothetical protein n=1 Tax=unclassified Sporosarcina TaxID=2647733 RepID=UPI000C169794|nr:MULTISPECIES: hypothetical protein [unclassified Sporosarcina]PID07344.1 hypothetical protein CSV66_01845 [Sporosarcina sp. P30]PID10540.1 hypothetical protein CSV65_01850 [Sporosarcina sp. P31]PID13125.1 hypothetical protein CSV64_04430 [Sporosarcina sp. P32b]